MTRQRRHGVCGVLTMAPCLAAFLCAQTPQRTAAPPPQSAAPTRANILRGAYGPYRANNDLLYYHLRVRVDPEKKYLSGDVITRFKMLQDGTRIQLDLHEALNVDKILMGDTPLKYERDSGAVFVDFPETLLAGRVYTIDFFYSGNPVRGITFRKDPAGRTWVNTSCEGIGASTWWPDKDQWRDEVDNMDISAEIPNGLVDASNGKFVGKTDLGDGYTRWDWHVNYPINNYDVSLNIGTYEHWSDSLGDLPLDFYALPEDLDKAKTQFAQAKGMLEAYQHYFGEYPFKKDGYKLIEAPYSGMEHQSAVTYGNHFTNGYLGRDWTNVGISPKFDFIIIHESAHEWFGNAITAADRSDMWIHEGWATYLEGLYVEYRWGKDDGIKYLNGYQCLGASSVDCQSKIRNRQPIVAARGVNASAPEDQYFKGALMLNTIRSVVDDDAKWFATIHDFFQHFKYQNIMTEDVEEYFSEKLGSKVVPIFEEYLRHADLPVLELKFDDSAGSVSYRWKVDEAAFAMPIRVGTKEHWEIIRPTAEWKTTQTPLHKDDFQVATDLYYVNVSKQ
jgi:aminopeptidase N